MIVSIVAAFGVFALVAIFLHSHIKDKAMVKLEQQKQTDQTQLVLLKAQEPTLLAQAVEQQQNATEQQKQDFWKGQLNEDSSSPPTNK